MSEITKAEITSFIHDKIPTGLAPGTINKILNAVKSIYARAVEWEAAGLEKNPAHGIKQLPDHPRHEKFLTQDEASRLLGAVATSQNKILGSIVALLLLTGCRKREVLDARWEYIDFEHGLLTIPLSKSGKPRRVLLSPAAKAVIIQSKQILRAELGEEADTCPWILPNPATGNHSTRSIIAGTQHGSPLALAMSGCMICVTALPAPSSIEEPLSSMSKSSLVIPAPR